VLSVEHHREGMEIGVAETALELTMLMRNKAHCDRLVKTMQRWGYSVQRVR